MLRLKKLRLQPAEIFNSEHMGQDLAGKTVRGGINTMGAQGALFVLKLGRTIVLAHLLTPQDFGLIGMVMVVVSFATMFKNAGLNMATVQRAEITHDQISTLFGINVLISVGLGMCIVAGAPLVASFYERPELTAVTMVLAFSFVIQGLTIQHAALLRRHMRFGALAIEKIVAAMVSLTVAIILALQGWSYWSLVGSTIASAVAMLIITYFFCPWRPGRMKKGTGVRDMLKFGGHLTGFNFINYFARNADNILIGKFIGADGLGIYAKAYQLFMMPITQVRGPLAQVAMPVLSSLKSTPMRYVKYYKNIVDTLATLMIPFAFYCALEADFLINFILGEQWLAAVPVFRVLAIGGVVISIAGTRGLVLMSHGYSKRYLHWGLANAIVTVASFLIGVNFGVVGVAFAYTTATYLVLIPSLFYCFNKTPITVTLFFSALAPALLNATIAAMVLLTLNYVFTGQSLIQHLLYAAAFALVYGGLTLCRKSVRMNCKIICKELPLLQRFAT